MATKEVSSWDSGIEANQCFVRSTLQEATSLSQLKDGFENMKNTNSEIMGKLIDILYLVKAHQHQKRILRTAETSVGGLGTVSAVLGASLAPFTGGLSTVLSVAGITTAFTSGIATIGTEIHSKLKSKKFAEEIEILRQKQQKNVAVLMRKLGVINDVVEGLTREGLSEETAIRAVLSLGRPTGQDPQGGYDQKFSAQRISDVVEYISELYKCGNLINLIGTGVSASTLVPAGGLQPYALEAANAVSSVGTKVARVTAKELRSLRNLLRSAGKSATSSTGKIVLKGIGAAAGVVFTIIDVTFLIKEWRTEDPLIEYIQNVVYHLNKDVDKFLEMIGLIEKLESPNSDTSI